MDAPSSPQPGILRADQRDQFDQDGFLILRDIFRPDDIRDAADALRKAAATSTPGIRRLHVPREDGTEFLWLSDLASSVPELRRVLFSSIGAFASCLLGDTGVVMAQDTAFLKPAGSGGAVGWHQDGSYWQHAVPLEMVTCWVALTRSDANCGAVRMLPGSHRLGLLKSTVFDAFSADPEAFLGRHGLFEHAPVTLELQPGDIAFHHALTVHGSPPNPSDSDRIGYVIHCLSDRARYHPKNVRFWQKEPLAAGQPFRGDKHPVLWPYTG